MLDLNKLRRELPAALMAARAARALEDAGGNADVAARALIKAVHSASRSAPPPVAAGPQTFGDLLTKRRPLVQKQAPSAGQLFGNVAGVATADCFAKCLDAVKRAQAKPRTMIPAQSRPVRR